MADVTSRLRLVVDSSGVDKAGKALRDLKSEAANVEARAKAMRAAFANLAAILGTAFSVQAIVNYADAWKRAENQIKTVQASLGQVRLAQEGVFAVAQKTFAAYDATAALYTKLTRAGAGLISGQKEALRLVETVNKALAVGGASASERNSVILQLGQAVGSGRLQGDEFRSISENAPLILDALAKSTNIARGALKELGAEGKITSEVLIKGIRDYSDEIDATFGKFSPTIGDSLTQLSNAFEKLLGENGSTAFSGLAASISLVATNLEMIAKLALAAGAAMGAIFVGRAISQAVTSFTMLQTAIAVTNAQLIAAEIRAGLVTGALGRMSVAGAAGAGAMRLLNGALAFFGGPIGLAITAVALALGGLAVAAGDASRDLSTLKAAGESAESVIGKYKDLLNPASKDTLTLAESVLSGSTNMETFAGKTGKAAQSLKEYAIAQKAAALADVEREQFALMSALSKNKQRLPAGRREDDREIQKALSFGERSRFRSPAEVAQAAGNVFAGDIQSWWTGGASDQALSDQISKDTKRLKELNDIGNQIGKTGISDPAWLKGWSDGVTKGTEKASKSAREATDAFEMFGLKLADLDRQMADFSASVEKGLIVPFEEVGKKLPRVTRSIADALNAAGINERLTAALDGGLEAYYDELARIQAIKDGILETDTKALAIAVAAAKAERQSADNLDKKLRIKDRLYYLDQKQVVDAANLATTDAFDRFFDNLPTKGLAAFKDLFDDIGDIFKQVWSEAMKAALDPFITALKSELSKAFDETFAKLKSVFTKALDGISEGLGKKLSGAIAGAMKAYAAYQVGTTASTALGGNKTAAQQQNGQIGAVVGAILGSVIPGVGTILGSFIGTTLGGLLGPSSSNNAASSLLDSQGKSTSGLLGTKRTDATSQAVNDFITVLQSGYSSLKELGGTLSTYVKNIEIGTRDLSKIDLSDGRQVRAAVGDTGAAQNAALIEVLKGTTFAVEALNKIKDGMIGAGSSFQTTYDTLVKVNGLLKANEPELSQWAKALKEIDDTFKPLIEATGAYTDALKDAYGAAKGALATNFDTDISEQIKAILNSPTDQLNDLLKAQAQRLEDAKAIGGDLAQVSRLAALEQRDFFKGLSDSALKEVGDFLGLFDQATNSVVRNLDLSRQDLRSRADAFGAFAEQFKTANSDLTQKYLVASPRESIDELRGRVNELLGGVASGNDSAAQALPQVVNQLVDAARSTFGNTKAFSDILNFAQSALGQASASALNVQSEAERQIAALDESNDILADIRDILASSQASSAFFQSYLSGGVATSDALIAAIQQGTGLTAAVNDNASALNITGLIAQSVQPIIVPLATSIDIFTERLSDMPNLQKLTINAVERGSDRVVAALAEVSLRLDRLELLERRQLEELEQANAA